MREVVAKRPYAPEEMEVVDDTEAMNEGDEKTEGSGIEASTEEAKT